MSSRTGHDEASKWLQKNPRIQSLLVVVCLCWFAAIAVWEARTNTPTIDEFVQVPAGLYYLETGKFDFDRRNPPLVKILTAAPLQLAGAKSDTHPKWRGRGEGWSLWRYGTRFMRLNAANYFDYYFMARLVVIALGVAGGFCLWWWARDWYGPAAAMATLIVYATCPNLLAHASLATLDLGVSIFLFAAFACFYRASKDWSPGWTLSGGILLGCALATKFVAVFFLPLVPVLLFLSLRPRGRKEWLRFGRRLLLIALAAWFVINGAYNFSGLPLPREWIDGILLKAGDKARAQSPMFFLGYWSTTGWWCYYPIAFLVKSTIPFIILIGAAIYAALLQRRKMESSPRLIWAWLAPLILFLIFATFLKIDFGIRYILPAFPFLILFAGAGITLLLRGGSKERAILGLLLAWQILSSALSAPNHLGYFNEAVGGPDRGRRILLDSNVDWGQDLDRLKTYMDENNIKEINLAYFGHVDPKLYGIAFSLPMPEPKPGLFAFSANYLAGYPHSITYTDDELVQEVPAGSWSWPETMNLKPVARVGSSIYIYRITPEDIKSAN